MKRYVSAGSGHSSARLAIAVVWLFLASPALASDETLNEPAADEAILDRIEETVVLPLAPTRPAYPRNDPLDSLSSPDTDTDTEEVVPTLDKSARNRVFEFVPRRRGASRERPQGMSQRNRR